MDHILDALFARISARGRLCEQDLADLYCFYPSILEHTAVLLDSPSNITVYRPSPGFFGGTFYVVSEYGRPYIVMPDEHYCNCNKDTSTTTPVTLSHSNFYRMSAICRHILTVKLATALKLQIKEVVDKDMYENTLMTLLMSLVA